MKDFNDGDSLNDILRPTITITKCDIDKSISYNQSDDAAAQDAEAKDNDGKDDNEDDSEDEDKKKMRTPRRR